MPESGDADERMRTLIHDLRTPLTLIRGFTDLLQARGDGLSPQERADFVDRIAAAARDLQRIVDAQA